MITRTIKNTKVTFFNANMETMSIETHSEIIPSGMSEAQAKKYLVEMGYNNPMELTIENIPAARYGLTEIDFYLCSHKIDKKSEIKGRSVTKEMTVQEAQAVVAMKVLGVDWEIKTIPVYMFDGNFDSRMYNTKHVKLLEVGEFSEPVTEMRGMTEEKFMEIGLELK